MPVVKISPQGQVKIPKEIMRRLHVNPGDYLEFEETDRILVVKPKKLIDADQAWFWTSSWQKAEQEASGDKAAGRTSPVFTVAEEGIAYLRRQRRQMQKTGKKRTMETP